MFGFRYAKFSPSSYVLHFANGRVVREGAGLSFFYFAPSSSIVIVPMASVGVPFAFTENTADFQTVTVQGQLTYRVVDHKKLARMMDFTVGPNGKYLTDDFQKLPERLINEIQPLVRAELQRQPLRAALTSAEAVSAAVLANLRTAYQVQQASLEFNRASAASKVASLRAVSDKSGAEVDFVIARGRNEVDAIECKWDPKSFDVSALKVFRGRYPKGRNYLVTPSGDPGYRKRVGSLDLRVCVPSELHAAEVP